MKNFGVAHDNRIFPDNNLSFLEDAQSRNESQGTSFSEILSHTKNLIEKFKPVKHAHLLTKLLDKIEPINFRELAGLENEDDKLQKKHFIVISIEQILQLAVRNDWGICRNHDFIYLYNGAYWSLIETEELTSFLGSAAERMGIDKFDARYHYFRDQLTKQFIATANLPKPEFPQDVVLINLENGTFEITPAGGILREFRRKDFLTYQLPFKYEPEAKAPLFENYLNRVLPQKGLQSILAEFIGYLFTRHLKLEKCLLLFGSGSNGKSVFFDVINAMLGPQNVSSYSLQSLTNETGYFRANLATKLLNYASEINGNLETAIFKALVSGEPIEARLPYGKPFILTNYAKMIFNCNNLPRDVEHTAAYFRRFLIIPFNVTILDEEKDPELAKKIIKHELSGVFNWVMEGLTRLLKQKNFTQNELVQQAVHSYKIQSDSVYMFFEEKNYIKSATAYRLLKDLYSDYRFYCNEDGYKPVNKTNFIKRLKDYGVQIERKNIGNVAYFEEA